MKPKVGMDLLAKHVSMVLKPKERMGTSHWRVTGPDGDRGWGGKCLPKDVNALIAYATEIGCDADIMEKLGKLT